MALFFRKMVLALKVESTYSTDIVPTAAADAVQATDVTISPMEGTDVDRALITPYLGADPTIPTDLHARMTFKVELAGSGTAGTAPAWSAVAKMLGLAETVSVGTNVIYNPISELMDAVSIYFNHDGTLYKLLGARGNATLSFNASGIPYLECAVTGLYTRPTDAAAQTPSFSGYRKPLVATKANTPTFTIDGDPFVLRSLSLDLGNEVDPSFLIGEEEIAIVDRSEMIQAQVRATPMATLNPFALAETQTTVALQLVHGTQAGNILTLDVPAAQVQRPESPTDGQGKIEWPLRLKPLPVSGNDQWTLTLT